MEFANYVRKKLKLLQGCLYNPCHHWLAPTPELISWKKDFPIYYPPWQGTKEQPPPNLTFVASDEENHTREFMHTISFSMMTPQHEESTWEKHPMTGSALWLNMDRKPPSNDPDAGKVPHQKIWTPSISSLPSTAGDSNRQRVNPIGEVTIGLDQIQICPDWLRSDHSPKTLSDNISSTQST